MEECVFCKMSRGEIPVKRIYENDNFFSILDQNPRTEGHSLVISKNHFEVFLDLPSTLGSELMDCIKKTSFKLLNKYKAEGFNIIQNNYEVAGQVVKHVHFHILPRRKKDGFQVLG